MTKDKIAGGIARIIWDQYKKHVLRQRTAYRDGSEIDIDAELKWMETAAREIEKTFVKTDLGVAKGTVDHLFDAENFDLAKVFWFSAMSGPFGLVLGNHGYENRAYLGPIEGKSEQEDIQKIIQYGTKLQFGHGVWLVKHLMPDNMQGPGDSMLTQPMTEDDRSFIKDFIDNKLNKKTDGNN